MYITIIYAALCHYLRIMSYMAFSGSWDNSMNMTPVNGVVFTWSSTFNMVPEVKLLVSEGLLKNAIGGIDIDGFEWIYLHETIETNS